MLSRKRQDYPPCMYTNNAHAGRRTNQMGLKIPRNVDRNRKKTSLWPVSSAGQSWLCKCEAPLWANNDITLCKQPTVSQCVAATWQFWEIVLILLSPGGPASTALRLCGLYTGRLREGHCNKLSVAARWSNSQQLPHGVRACLTAVVDDFRWRIRQVLYEACASVRRGSLLLKEQSGGLSLSVDVTSFPFMTE